MCIACGQIEVTELMGLCEGCAIDLRAEVARGIHELEVYLDGGAAFGDRPPDRDEG